MIQKNTIKSLTTKYFYAVDKLNRILKRNIITITTQRFTDNVIYNKKVSSVFVINNYMLYNQKRFVGGDKPVGHARKVLNAINKHEPKLNIIPPKMEPKTTSDLPKEVKEVPYTDMILDAKKIPFKEETNDTSIAALPAKILNTIDTIAKDSASSQNSNKIVKGLLKQAEAKQVIMYEDVYEEKQEHKSSGSPKLTKKGLEFYNALYEKITAEALLKDTKETHKNLEFIAGMLKIESETIIPLPKQMHLVVAYDNTTNLLKVIGILTSENDANHIELSQNQPIAGIENKKQFLRLLTNPVIVSKDQIELHEKATNYVRRPDIHNKIISYKDQYTKKESLPYNNMGVTKEDLSNLLNMQEVKVPKKLNHFEQLKRNENSETKQKKVELNRQKQKEDHLKKLKEKEIRIQNEEID